MTDALIIGSGPAGLSAGIYARRAGLLTVVAEKVNLGTGQAAYSNMVDNYPGFMGINGYELGERFREHAVSLGVEFKNAKAVSFIRENNVWKVTFANGDMIEAKTVIYAAGAVHRRLNIPGEKEFAGKGVSYCAVCDGAFFKGKTVAVIGGGDTALSDAVYLSDICGKVYIIHRRNEFRGLIKMQEKLKEKSNVELVMNQRVKQILGDKVVTELVLEDGRTLAADGVFIAVGMEPVTDAVKDIVNLDNSGYIIADETGRTSAEGFFAAGDVRVKELRQIVTAAADGANAAVQAEKYIRSI